MVLTLPAPQRTGVGLVIPRDNSVGASVWESSIQTLLPAKPHTLHTLSLPLSHPTKSAPQGAPKLVPTQSWRASLSTPGHLCPAHLPACLLQNPTDFPGNAGRDFLPLCAGVSGSQRNLLPISRSKSPGTCHSQQPAQHYPHPSAVKSTFPQS